MGLGMCSVLYEVMLSLAAKLSFVCGAARIRGDWVDDAHVATSLKGVSLETLYTHRGTN